jgi:hypothetical protein
MTEVTAIGGVEVEAHFQENTVKLFQQYLPLLTIPRSMSVMSFLVTFGFPKACVLEAREFLPMVAKLFGKNRGAQPTSFIAEDWQIGSPVAAVAPHRPPLTQTSCLDCAECPAQALCHDDSISGQVTRVLAERQPAIVTSTRIEALLAVLDNLTTA